MLYKRIDYWYQKAKRVTGFMDACAVKKGIDLSPAIAQQSAERLAGYSDFPGGHALGVVAPGADIINSGFRGDASFPDKRLSCSHPTKLTSIVKTQPCKNCFLLAEADYISPMGVIGAKKPTDSFHIHML